MRVIAVLLCLVLLASPVSAEDGFLSRIASFLSTILDSVKSFISSQATGDVRLRHGDLFDFESGRKDAVYPDCDFEETPFAKNGQLQQAGLRTCMAGNDIANLGAVDYDTATVPAESKFESNPPAIAGNVYLVKASSGGYVKVQVTAVHSIDEVSFRWGSLPGKWKRTTTTLPGGLVTVTLDVNTTVECNVSMGYDAIYAEYTLAYNNMTTYMAAGEGDTPDAAASYERYRQKKACYDLIT